MHKITAKLNGKKVDVALLWFEIKKIYLYDHGRKIECDPWKLDTPIEPDLIAIDLGRRIA